MDPSSSGSKTARRSHRRAVLHAAASEGDHDRLWAHLQSALDDVDGVELKDDGVTREIRVGTQFVVRVKRHDATDRVRSYPTRRALTFWAQSVAFEGFEDIHLGFGYRWDREERSIGSAIISLHDGLGKKPVWAVQLADGGEQAATPFTWTPVEPDLPQLDLSEAIAKDEEEGQTS
ncbi:hypothetical protein [Saccharopolyspora shandongensis]|uniref:hypothetical protein n=1 Tax=Saccharopolyspora shandongensis TaxID=418495 RepID=UPI0033D29F7E